MYDDEEIFAALEEFGNDLIADIDKSLNAKGHGSKANGGTQSSRIIGSSNFKIDPSNGGMTLSFYMNDYWYFLEYGRGKSKGTKTKKPFKDTLAGKLYDSGWDVGKGINAREWYRKKLKHPEKSKKLKDYEGLRKSLAHALAYAIHKKGTIKRFGYKGSHFLSDVLKDGRFEKLSEKLSTILGSKIVIDISEAFK